MVGVRVRRAAVEDMDAMWPLVCEFAASFRPERDPFERTFRTLLNSRGGLVLVAHVQDRIVGYLLAHTHHTFFANGPVAWVEEVMVDERERSMGIGRALMAEAERWACDRGAAYVSLASRRAGNFYLQLGYEDSAVFYKKNARSPK
ncbi:GNAT family N-acetyltransferase [Actinopolymorpha alba]|uniref:GNAT family N-acetyltransferase n=1 Tax=Actinopolymorpha alba TaxID=533267 RepID=UPI00036C2134|nr:GNAT family N-acetyltransferase [Actinopolymorpha alba]